MKISPLARRGLALAALLTPALLPACSSDDSDAAADSGESPSAFELKFAAIVDGKPVGCTDDLAGFGPAGAHHIGINDIRFYVSNLVFKDASGKALEVTLDQNEFQLVSADGTVSLVDLTGNTDGSCSTKAVGYAEGTARTHTAITGKTKVGQVASVSFDVGVPQGLVKKTIANNTPEGSPSPLNEMYWNWNSGYRHFVFNFGVKDGAGKAGEGYVHIGSRDCAPMDMGKALADRDACTFVNTPSVALSGFDLKGGTVGIDLRRILKGLDFVAPIYDPMTFEVIGMGPGVECHSSPAQPHCSPIFSAFGLDMATGVAGPSDAAVVKAP